MGDDPLAVPRHAGEGRHPRLSNDFSIVPDESKSMLSGISYINAMPHNLCADYIIRHIFSKEKM
jgi:hypothetical protein